MSDSHRPDILTPRPQSAITLEDALAAGYNPIPVSDVEFDQTNLYRLRDRLPAELATPLKEAGEALELYKKIDPDASDTEIDDLFVLGSKPVNVVVGTAMDRIFDSIRAFADTIAQMTTAEEILAFLESRAKHELPDTMRKEVFSNFEKIIEGAKAESAHLAHPRFEASQPPVFIRLNIYHKANYEPDPANRELLRSTELVQVSDVAGPRAPIIMQNGLVGFLNASQVICRSVEEPGRIWYPQRASFDRRYEPAG